MRVVLILLAHANALSPALDITPLALPPPLTAAAAAAAAALPER